MSPFVHDFADGDKDQKDLLGGKGANLAEMTNLGLPVPPGFTIDTEACRAYLDGGGQPEGLAEEVTEHLGALEGAMGRRLGDGADPLLVSVRSGAKFSMPGMMETVLNVGLNDESVEGLARESDSDRFAWDSYRRLIQMFGATVMHVDSEHFSEALDAAKRAKGTQQDLDLDADDLARARRDVQDRGAPRDRPRLPAGPARAARPRDQRRLRLLEHRPRAALPTQGAHPRRPRHRRQRPGDGLRQPRHGLRLGRRLHPRPGERRPGRLRRLPAERPGRGRRRRHPQHGLAGGLRGVGPDVVRRPDGDHGEAREALQGHVRHRVHRRTRQAVDAADPRRQAHSRGGVPDRGRHGRREPDQTTTRPYAA